MMQIKTVYADKGTIQSMDEEINIELRRLGKKAFAIQYEHWFKPNPKKPGTNAMHVVAHIQYEEDESL